MPCQWPCAGRLTRFWELSDNAAHDSPSDNAHPFIHRDSRPPLHLVQGANEEEAGCQRAICPLHLPQMHLPAYDPAGPQTGKTSPLTWKRSLTAFGRFLSFLNTVPSACETIPTKTQQIHHHAFTSKPAAPVQDFQEEYASIQNRLLAVANGHRIPNGQPLPAIHAPPSNFTGLSCAWRQHSGCHLSSGTSRGLDDMQRLG